MTSATFGVDLAQVEVFGLFPDEEGEVAAELERIVGRHLPLEAVDHLGVTSRLWPISDQHAVSVVNGLLGPKPVFIADGHHRYETAHAYQAERRAELAGQAGKQPREPGTAALANSRSGILPLLRNGHDADQIGARIGNIPRRTAAGRRD